MSGAGLGKPGHTFTVARRGIMPSRDGQQTAAMLAECIEGMHQEIESRFGGPSPHPVFWFCDPAGDYYLLTAFARDDDFPDPPPPGFVDYDGVDYDALAEAILDRQDE